MIKEYFIHVLCILFTRSLFANPEPTEVNDYHIVHSQFWKQALQDTKEVITAPACWDKHDLAIVALVVAGTVGLMTIDKQISDGLSNKKIQPLHGILAVSDKFGYEYYVIPALAGTYVLGEVLHNYKARKIALLSIESFLLAGGFAQIGKYLLHRQRPRSKGSNPFRYDGPSFKMHHLSFPSGHTACAFAVAAVIAEEFKEEGLLIPITVYTLASLTGIARIERKDHWPSDVFFGACLGVAVGRFIAKLHPENPTNEDWEVCISPQARGLQLALGRSF